MHHGTITTPVSTTVTLGANGYGRALYVAGTGAVEPTAAGVAAIVAASDLTSVRLVNQGSVLGGGGANDGSLGGNGIDLAVFAKIDNSGSVAGGGGGYGTYFGGSGGTGVELSGGGHLSNTGEISGGGGHNTYFFYTTAGDGGVGVSIDSSVTILNSGDIDGGLGGSVVLGSDGGGYGYSGAGGVGVQLDDPAKLVNHGNIVGGAGGYYAPFGPDGFYYGKGGAGGAGVSLLAGGSVSNTGSITGGGSGGSAYNNSQAGAGIFIFGGGTVSNHGLITGGAAGGSGAYSSSGAAGGIGVDLTYGGTAYGSTLTNHGTIVGGAGGYEVVGAGGAGGAGVNIDGATLVNFGTIIGGAGGAGINTTGPSGDSVQFGSVSGTLVVEPGAVFEGAIVADSAASDTLVLAAKGAGVLANVGAAITGFANIVEDAHAHWTLTGSGAAASALVIGTGATLTLDAAIGIPAISFGAGGGENFRLNGDTPIGSTFSGFNTGDAIDLLSVQATSLKYGHGTLTLFDAAHSVVGTLAFSGDLTKSDFGLKADGHGGTEIYFVGGTEGLEPGAGDILRSGQFAAELQTRMDHTGMFQVWSNLR